MCQPTSRMHPKPSPFNMTFLVLMAAMIFYRITTTPAQLPDVGTTHGDGQVSLNTEVLQSLSALNSKVNKHYEVCSPTWTYGLLLLVLSGDIHSNPGHRPPKYPCGICSQAVRNNQDSIQCDDCDRWYHRECLMMSTPVFLANQNPDISWLCTDCGMPNFSSSLFEDPIPASPNTYHSRSLDNTDELSHIGSPQSASSPKPVKQARRGTPKVSVLSMKCNSIKSTAKNSEFRALLDLHDPDIVTGCESKLDPTVATYSVFPEDYEVYRKDRTYHGGGVFCAIKMNLISMSEDSLSRDNECIWVDEPTQATLSAYWISQTRWDSSNTSLT